MDIRELISALEDIERENDRRQVYFAYNYGDHWKTTVAPEVVSVDEGRVAHSAYHNMDKVVTEEEKGYADANEAVVLNLSRFI